MKPNKEKVAKRIHEIRTSLGYSMDEFGKLLGDVPRSSVNNWEKAVSVPKQDKLEKIASLGRMMPEQILYGRADEYLFDLIYQNFGAQLSDSILYEIFETIPKDQRSYDDAIWLSVAEYFLKNGTYGKTVGTIVYTSLLGMENLYAGRYKNEFIEQSMNYNQLEVKYYIYVEIEKNRLHVIPFSLNENNKAAFFEVPTFLEERGNHNCFTENFKDIGLQLDNSSILYYGIDKELHEPTFSLFNYNSEKDCYTLGTSNKDDYYLNFEQELEKELANLNTMEPDACPADPPPC